MQFPYPVILCDIGGTNVRVALVRDAGAPIELLGHLKTEAFFGLAESIEAALASCGILPRSVIACAAGPMNGRELKLTNAAWHIDGLAIAERLGLAQGLLLNDFEAQALALPALDRVWLTPIGGPVPGKAGTRIILGPGTGLGAAALIEVDGRFAALPSEPGHIGFGPVTPEEVALWPYLEAPHGRVTAETVLSGPGLVRLHRARLMAAGQPAPVIDDAGLVDCALLDRSGEEACSLRLFWRLVGRFSGDLALVFLAHGGVTLGGGVLPHILPFLDPQDFRSAFEAKAPLEAVARSISTQIITTSDAVLTGMATIAASPESYALDYASRAWR